MKQNLSTGRGLKKKKKSQRKAEIEENKQQGENLSQIENDIANTKDDIKSAGMILQSDKNRLSKELKKTKLCQENMKLQSIIQMTIVMVNDEC